MPVEGQTIQEHIESIVKLFYQNKIKEGAIVLPELTKELSTIAMNLSGEDQLVFLNALKLYMQAMESKDYVLVADVLYFEILDVLGTQEV